MTTWISQIPSQWYLILVNRPKLMSIKIISPFIPGILGSVSTQIGNSIGWEHHISSIWKPFSVGHNFYSSPYETLFRISYPRKVCMKRNARRFSSNVFMLKISILNLKYFKKFTFVKTQVILNYDRKQVASQTLVFIWLLMVNKRTKLNPSEKHAFQLEIDINGSLIKWLY